MLFTKATKQAAIRMVEGEQQHPSPLPDATRKRILNSTIKFYGNTKNKQKDKKGNEAYEVFKGSGVIYMLDANRVYILTAAHNVQLWAIPEDPATNWNNFASLFAKAVTIGYGNRDMSFNSPPTGNADKGKSNAAAPPVLDGCKKEDNCLYDVLVVTSTDNALRTYAKDYVFGGQTFDQIAAQLKQEATMLIKSSTVLLDSSLYHYIQLGYGNTTNERTRTQLDKDGKIEILKDKKDKNGRVIKVYKNPVSVKCQVGTNIVANQLQYRLASPSFKQYQPFYNQNADEGKEPLYELFPQLISLKGKRSSTTAPGDSGGPLYAVEKKNPANSYLLGVTTGADMELKKQPATAVFKNVLSTSVVPYFKTLFPDIK